ncbi:hypothetical protein L195_g005446 [Trifolium pratense]|uniref:RNase H type-1 domain-containing protein n=1 Tax=Trifolium pratense TaxID=57577 RepID=A0A2K3P0U5_TRIPR|nr:hypothetical protein L195_g005446 [Trifolium pratense]
MVTVSSLRNIIVLLIQSLSVIEEGVEEGIIPRNFIFNPQTFAISAPLLGTNIAVAHSDIAELIWKPPPESYVKCNIDAAIFSTDCKVDMGAVLRDNAGQFIAATSGWCTAAMTGRSKDLEFTKRP